MKKKGTRSILRKEFFGGTLFDVISGKRVYISNEEYAEIKKVGELSIALQGELRFSGHVELVEPEYLFPNGFSSPDTVFFELTKSCNLRCSHCLNDSGVVSSNETSTSQKIASLRSAARAGVQEVRFTGGEPLMHIDICTLIETASVLNMRSSMGTNATLVTAAMAKDLVRSGLCSSIVSIEGDEKTHDLIRGNGSYKRALAGLINLMDQGIDVRINMVLMKSNISSIVSVLELSSKLNIPIFLRRFVPSGRGMENQGEVLTANDYEKLRMDLEKYLLEPRGLVQGHYLAEKKAEIRASLPFTRYSCSAGQRGIIITPNGHVHTCGFLAMLGEKVLGKTPEEEISIIWKRLTESNHMEFLRKKLDLHNAGNEQIVTNCLAIPKIYR